MFKDIHRSPGECRCRSGFSGPGCQVKCACILVYPSILVTLCTCNIVTCIIAVCLMVLPDCHQDCVRLLGCVHGTCQQPYQCLCKVIIFKYLPHLLQLFFVCVFFFAQLQLFCDSVFSAGRLEGTFLLVACLRRRLSSKSRHLHQAW